MNFEFWLRRLLTQAVSPHPFVKQRDELSIHLGRVLLITIPVGLGKIALGVAHLLHEVDP